MSRYSGQDESAVSVEVWKWFCAMVIALEVTESERERGMKLWNEIIVCGRSQSVLLYEGPVRFDGKLASTVDNVPPHNCHMPLTIFVYPR